MIFHTFCPAQIHATNSYIARAAGDRCFEDARFRSCYGIIQRCWGVLAGLVSLFSIRSLGMDSVLQKNFVEVNCQEGRILFVKIKMALGIGICICIKVCSKGKGRTRVKSSEPVENVHWHLVDDLDQNSFHPHLKNGMTLNALFIWTPVDWS